MSNNTCKRLPTLHKRYAVIALLALFFILLPLSSSAERRISSFPFSEDFEANDYQDLVWVTNGARHEWMSSGGWDGGGAAKFYPITVDQGYNGLGQFQGMDTEQLNVRFLINHGSRFNSAGLTHTKVIIFNRNDYRERPMIGGRVYDDGTHRAWGACDNTVCRYEGGDMWPDGTDSFKIGAAPYARSEEWISVEFSANSRTGVIRLYITSQDGALNGLYVQQQMAGPGGTFNYIDVLGGYFNTASAAHPDNYFIIDKLVIDDNYIGPPEGFIAGNPPSPPTILE
ncbi:MAG: hypothetical protein ABW157_15470 [Candidatus Thiodiazotropha sp. LLP2]